MKRALSILIIVWSATLLFSPATTLAAAEAAPAPTLKTATSEIAAQEQMPHEEVAGELIPISPAAQKQALIQAIWVIIIFVVLLAILYPTAWKGVLHGLKTREERIRKDIADAEATRAKAQATLAQYNQQLATAEERVREMLAKAGADGQQMAAAVRDAAAKEAQSIKNKALADIDDARKHALTEIHALTADLATSIAEKIIRRNLNPDDQRDLVNASLDQLQQGHRN